MRQVLKIALTLRQSSPFDSKEWLPSHFPLQYYPRITHSGHENKEKDHQLDC